MVDIQLRSIRGTPLTVCTTWSARSHLDQIWSTHLYRNMIPVESDYTLRCIQQTGGGVHRDEIGSDRLQVVGVSHASLSFFSLLVNSSTRVNRHTHYRIVRPDSAHEFRGR